MSLPKNYSNYTINELGTVAQRVNTVVSPLNFPVYNGFNDALMNYEASLKRNISSAAELIQRDYKRDNTFRGMSKLVDAYACSNNKELASIANAVDKIISSSGGYLVTRANYKEQTTLTNRIISDIEKLPATDLEKIHLNEWLPLLKEENTEFETVLSNYLSTKVENSEVLSASENRKALEKSMQTIMEYVELMVKVATTPELEKCYNQLEETLKR